MTDPLLLIRATEQHEAGRFAEAERTYRQYLSEEPGQAAVWNNYAVLALDRGDWLAALERASRAISLAPERPTFHCTRAFALNGLGRLAEAIGTCLWVIQNHRDCAPAWFGLGAAQARQGRDEEAIAAYRTALQWKPDYVAAANNLGTLLTNRNDFDGAVAAFRSVLQMAPGDTPAHNNLGITLLELGCHEEALASYRRALACDPTSAKAHSSLLLALQYIPGTTPGAIVEEGRRWWRQHGAPLWPGPQHFPNLPDPERPLRIGYISSDFRDHPVGRHLLPLLREHDARLFATTAYSGVRIPDQITARFRDLGVGWREVAHLTDDALAALIREDRIDILVELSLHTGGERLLVLARQPAPVQISFAGYPGETGLESIAHHLTDRVLEPPGPAHGFSAPLHLPDSFWCMDPPEEAPEVNPLPALTGAPLVFGCLHKFAKVHAAVLELWGQILRALPNARLQMLCPPGSARERVLTLFREHGVTAERLDFTAFLPRREYLARHHRIDVILDTFPYNGHMTAVDALWMGVPFVTLTGELPVSRGGASILTQLGLPELIAQTPADYVRIAIALAGDLPRLASLRATLRDRMKASPLMDGPRFARSVEAAYRTAWQRWCATPLSTPRDTPA